MELERVSFSQVIQFFHPLPEDETPIDSFDWVKGLEARYKFWEVPRKVPEYDASRGMVFQHGNFKDLTIEKLTVYENGALCQSDNATTAQIEEFMDDALQWSHDAFGVDLARFKRGPRAYTSSLVLKADFQLGERFAAFASFGKAIGDVLRSYGQQAPDFQVGTIGFHGDYTKMPIPQAGSFVFERRAANPYSSGLYFSSAPVRTEDHMNLLNALESALVAST